MNSLTIAAWMLALIGGVLLTTYLLRRLFGPSDGSVAKDFKTQVERALALDKEIKKLKEESTRGTADFQEALKKHRATYGSGKRPDADIDKR